MHATLARAALGIALCLPAGCGSAGSDEANGAGLSVVAAFYPLEFVVTEVGGDAVAAAALTPPGVEPHDLELSSGQMVELLGADLVVYIGGGFQPGVEEALTDLDDQRKLDALGGRELLAAEQDREEDEEEHAHDAVQDPHVWLDPSLLAEIAADVGVRLAELDPANAQTYENNAADLVGRLNELDASFKEGLSECDSDVFVTSHTAFGYLAARYDLEQVGVSGIDPEAEPAPRRLAEVADFVEEHDVRVVFFEELASPDLAETIAEETGARTDVLATLETEPRSGGYIDAMTDNLQRLRAALGCD